VNKYEIIKKLGSGVGTVVNLCKKNDKKIVIKELTDAKYYDNLEDELNILSSIPKHKHIIDIQNSFIFDKKIYVEYEYCKDGDLYDFIKQKGTLDETKALLLLSQISSALIHAKNSGFYHCDIKPENILLRDENEFVISDWDLAKNTNTNSISLNHGSTLTMAPEIMLGELSENSDVYSLGCLLYFCLFGKRVFDLKISTPQYERVLTHLETKFKLPPNNLSKNFQKILISMLYKNPKKRISLEEISNFLDKKEFISKDDTFNIYDSLSDFISDKRIEENKKVSFEKFSRYKKEFEKDKNESSKNSMLAHLIILSYLKDKESQSELSTYYKDGILIKKDLIKEELWKSKAIGFEPILGKKIFVSLAAYCDDMLEFTLKSAYNSAKNKENIFFGVVDQNYENQRELIKTLDFSEQIRYCHTFPDDTLGVSWARHLVFSLYDNEDYFLQVDSHTYFEENWDENLINQYEILLKKSQKPIISTYPYGFSLNEDGEVIYKKPSGKSVLVLRPKEECSLTKDSFVLQFRAKHIISNEAVAGCHIAAGFLFTKGSFIEEIPYDPYLYFHGEEQSLSLRAFTKGWDIYHPTWIPLYHLYKKTNVSYNTHHWNGEISKKRDFEWTYLQKRSKNRLEKLIKGKLNNSIYGLGTIRTIEEYIDFSGIDYFNYIVRIEQ